MISFPEALDIIKHGIADIYYPPHPAGLYKPIDYLLGLKGKKVRPALTLLACNLYKDDVSEALPMALAWEIFHNFTLMHDDVMDNADMRRGQPTVHKKWDENTAILSGDAMLIMAYQYIERIPKEYRIEAQHFFSQTALQICEGQQYDMDFENRLDVSEGEYLQMITLKTAVMIAGATMTGGIIGGAGKEDCAKLYDFGLNLGLAFQIQDDLLDVYGNPEVFGKNIGGDILCGKKTYLLVKALNTGDQELKSELMRWLDTDGNPAEKIAAVTAIYDRMSLKEIAFDKKEQYYHKALQALDEVNLPHSRKAVLFDLAAELMDRTS